MELKIFFTFVCILAIATLTTLIITNNKEYDGKTSPGWWVVSIFISQIFIVPIMAVWWKEWWNAHQWLMYISTGIALLGTLLWAIAKISIRWR